MQRNNYANSRQLAPQHLEVFRCLLNRRDTVGHRDDGCVKEINRPIARFHIILHAAIKLHVHQSKQSMT